MEQRSDIFQREQDTNMPYPDDEIVIIKVVTAEKR